MRYLNVKVVSVTAAESTDVRGTEVDLSKAYGSDQTGAVKTHLWINTITAVTVSSSYTLTHMTTRTSEGKLSLNTTENTVMTKTADMVDTDTNFKAEISDKDEQYMSTHSEATAVEVSQAWECTVCHKPQVDFNSKSPAHCCGDCRLKQTISCYRSISRAVNIKCLH